MPATESQPVPGPAPFQREVVLPPRRARHKTPRTSSPHLVEHQASPAASQQPSPTPSLPPTEAFYLEIFRSQAANQLSGYFESRFWTQRVLEECHAEPAIRHAVVGLGALYQNLEETAEASQRLDASPITEPDTSLGHWQVAVKAYSEACNALVLLNTEDLSSHKILIMASVLLATFDSFIGDHKQAIIQIQNGLGLLERLRVRKSEQSLSAVEDPLEQDLEIMFTRLAIQAKSYDLAFHFPRPFVIQLIKHPQGATSSISSGRGSPTLSQQLLTIPERFTTLLEARAASDKFHEGMLRFVEGLFKATNADMKQTLPQSWKDYGLEFKNQLHAWSNAFEPIFLSRHDPSASPRDKAGIAVLKMLQVNIEIMFLMVFNNQECGFDAYMPDFEMIVNLGMEVVGDEERRAAAEQCPDPRLCQHRRRYSVSMLQIPGFHAPHIKPSFSADLGIIPPLYVVATKCRDYSIRRQAIQILRSSSRREAMWDGEMSALIGNWIMNLEESDDQLYPNPQTLASDPDMILDSMAIPEERRVTVKSVDFDLRARVADLVVGSRGLQPGVVDTKLRQTRITW